MRQPAAREVQLIGSAQTRTLRAATDDKFVIQMIAICWLRIARVLHVAPRRHCADIGGAVIIKKELYMRSTRLIQVAIIFGMASASAMAADTFANGQSFYGQPAQQAAKARVVDVSTARHLNVAYGDTVTFRSEGKEFSWTFNGLDRRPVDLAKIAPAGFTGKSLNVYVAQNPLTRN